MNILKGKILTKLHNCFFCHNKKKFFFPKIKNQYIDFLFFIINQYKFKKNIFTRKNFIMSSQIQNISFIDIKNILFYISNYI